MDVNMKPLNWTTKKEHSDYMRMRQEQNISRAVNNTNENWMYAKLLETPYKWKRQALWGYRIFDFWCHNLGIAVEVDGPEHNIKYDAYRDEYNFRRSGILVLRAKNLNEHEAKHCVMLYLKNPFTWKERKDFLNLNVSGMKNKRWLVNRSFPPYLNIDYRECKLLYGNDKITMSEKFFERIPPE